jgi:hypothetical protein
MVKIKFLLKSFNIESYITSIILSFLESLSVNPPIHLSHQNNFQQSAVNDQPAINTNRNQPIDHLCNLVSVAFQQTTISPVSSTPVNNILMSILNEAPTSPMSISASPNTIAHIPSLPFSLQQSHPEKTPLVKNQQQPSVNITSTESQTNLIKTAVMKTSQLWKSSWLQINKNVLPVINFEMSANINFSLSKSYKECVSYVSLWHLNQIGLYDAEFMEGSFKLLFKSYIQADLEQSIELKLMTIELNLSNNYKKLNDNQMLISHLVNLQEFHFAFLKKKVYIKDLGRDFSPAAPNGAFVRNYQKVLNQSGGLMVITRPDDGNTIVWPFHKLPSGRLLGCDNCINVLRQLFSNVNLDANMQEIEDEVVLEKIANFYQLMIFHINEKVQLKEKMNTTFVNLTPFLNEYKDNVKLLCQYDDTFPEKWLNDYEKYVLAARPLVREISNSGLTSQLFSIPPSPVLVINEDVEMSTQCDKSPEKLSNENEANKLGKINEDISAKRLIQLEEEEATSVTSSDSSESGVEPESTNELNSSQNLCPKSPVINDQHSSTTNKSEQDENIKFSDDTFRKRLLGLKERSLSVKSLKYEFEEQWKFYNKVHDTNQTLILDENCERRRSLNLSRSEIDITFLSQINVKNVSL